ncbi:MAG TPA: hypothetical protein PLT64_04640 [Syntrophales bacterium]|nr:hypothetical protein [Syntrophales bacterium]HOL59140.1 hypothetical protein [Syntrophales bacterium]HPO36085.1 hypothetical protein [Syntrophales bacterium]
MVEKFNLSSWGIALITYATCAVISLGVAGIIKLIFLTIQLRSGNGK